MSLKDLAQTMSAQGRGPDDVLVHMSTKELNGLQGLAMAAGGSLTINPKTGLPEAGFLDSLLPSILGFAANFIVPGSGMLVGAATGALQNKENPLMGALLGGVGGYGAGNLAAGLSSAGAAANTAQAIANPALAGQAVNAGAGSQAAMLAAQNAGFGAEGLGQLAQAAGGTAPTATQALGAGINAAVTNPSNYLSQMGGALPAIKSAAMASAPTMLYQPKIDTVEEETELPRYDYTAGLTGNYYGSGNDFGTQERRYFTDPTFTRRMAEGGQVGSYRDGGIVSLQSGGFIIPADVVSAIGSGSSSAGLEVLAKMGAKPIDGKGDGQSDSIPAKIDGKQKAAVAREEEYLPPAEVKRMGGAKKLYSMMDNIRKQATGTTKQARPVNVRKAMA